MHSTARAAGTSSAFVLMLVFFTAMHSNGVLLLLLGLPFERALPWHRLLGYSATIQGLVHGFAYYAAQHKVADRHSHVMYFAFMRWSHALGMEVSGMIHKPSVSCMPDSIKVLKPSLSENSVFKLQ
jgi:hypothetical protein